LAGLFASRNDKKNKQSPSQSGGLFSAHLAQQKEQSDIVTSKVTANSRANRNEERLSKQDQTLLAPKVTKTQSKLGVVQPLQNSFKMQPKVNPAFKPSNPNVTAFKPVSHNPINALYQQVRGNPVGSTVELPSTGSKKLDKAAHMVGETAGQILQNPAGGTEQLLAKGIGNTAGKLLPKLAPHLLEEGAQLTKPVANTFMQKAAPIAAKAGVSALTGAIENTVAGAGIGQTSGRELGMNAAVGGTLGGVGHLLGAGIAKGLDNLKVRRAAVKPGADQAVQKAFETVQPVAPKKLGVAYGKLKPASNEQYINKVMGDIKSTVYERMTPPLENQKELAKWLRPHLGDASLNEIRKLSYEDMRQLAEEVKGHLSMYDVAQQAARERGYNLDNLLNNKTPSIKQTADRLRMGAVAGAVDAPKGNVRIAVPKSEGKFSQPLSKLEPVAVESIKSAKDSWFNRLFGSNNLGIKAGGAAKRTGTGVQIVNNPLKNDTQGLINQARETGRAIKQDYIDATAPLKHLGGDVQDIALDARRANNLANTWVHDKAVTPEGQVIGNSLKDVIGAVPRGQGHAFEDYLIVRHAKTRVARGEKVYEDRLGMNDVPKLEARQEQLEARYPEFKRLGDEWDKYFGSLRNLGQKEYRLISSAQKGAMEKANPNYASNRRQFSKSEKYSQAIGAKANSFSGQKGPIKEVSPTGSARKIVSPVRSAIEQTGAWHVAGMRNRVMLSILDILRTDPESLKGIVKLVPESSDMRSTSVKEINDALEDGGMDGLAEMLNNEFSGLFTKAKVTGGKTDNIVTAMEDGTPVKMAVENPEVFKALSGLAPQEMGVVMGTFKMLSNATKHGATGTLAPLFAAKGATTDVATALIQSKNPGRHVVDLVHAVLSSIANKVPKGTKGFEALRGLAQDFQRTGGEYSAALRGDRALNRSVGALRREPLLSPKGIAKGVKATVKAPFRFLEGISDIAENVNRIAAYKGELRRGGNVRTPENVRRAMRESQEITTNFSKKGAKTDTIEAFIPYSNAAVQSIRRFNSQWAKYPVKTTVLAATVVILPKLWETAKFGNDPDYQKLPARTRYRNLIVQKNADGTFVQLPMPPEYEALGAMAGDAMMKYKDGNPVKWGDAADAIMNAYTPPFVSGAAQGATQGGGVDQSVVGALNSTVIGPIAGYAHNQSWTGAPIVPQRLQGNSPYMQKDERTSSLASWVSSTGIGKKLGLSPIKLDYLAKQYGGDIARLGLPQLTDMGSGTKVQSLLRNFIVDPTFTNNLSRDYYNRIQKVTNNITDVGDGAAAPAWLTDEVKKLATSRAKGSPLKMLTDLSAEKRSIQGDKLLSTSEKALKLRENQRQINNIYLDVTSRLEKLGVPK
jgi:hypothetical protein